MTIEEFKPILDFPGYRVSNLGRVQTCRKRVRVNGRVSWPMGDEWSDMVQVPTGRGYMHTGLFRNGKKYSRQVGILVLSAFVGPRPPRMECCHGPGGPSDNRLENVRWDTKKANEADKLRDGTLAWGSRIGTSKLSEEDILEIRRLASEGISVSDLSSRFRTTLSNISRIAAWESWVHLPGDPNHRREPLPRAKLDETKKIEVRRLYAEGIPLAEIARRFGVSPPTVCRVGGGTRSLSSNPKRKTDLHV